MRDKRRHIESQQVKVLSYVLLDSCSIPIFLFEIRNPGFQLIQIRTIVDLPLQICDHFIKYAIVVFPSRQKHIDVNIVMRQLYSDINNYIYIYIDVKPYQTFSFIIYLSIYSCCGFFAGVIAGVIH